MQHIPVHMSTFMQALNMLPMYRTFMMALTFLFINIHSFHTHKTLLDALLQEEKVDTFLLNETFLTPKLPCKVSPFTILRHDNALPARRANGGVAIGFSRTVPHRIHKPPLNNLPEHLVITLYYRHLYITVITIYIRPGHEIPLSFFQYISNNFHTYIIMADINLHSQTPRRRQHFIDFIRTNTTGSLQPLPQPTRPISQTKPDVVIVSHNLTRRLTIEILDTLGSDHVPIKLTLQTYNPRHLPPPDSPPTLRYDKADWTKYRQFITDHIHQIENPTTEDDLYQTLSSMETTLRQASEKFIPRTYRTSYKPCLPPQYLPLIRRSRQSYRDYIRTRDPEALRLHRQWQRTVHNYLTAYKLRSWIKTCNTLGDTAHPTKYWKRFHQLTGQTSHTTYPLLQDEQPLHDDTDKANAFADHLQDIFTPLPPPRARHPTDRFNIDSPFLQPSVTHPILPDHPLTAPITVDDIRLTTARRRTTAPGLDGITYKHISQSPILFLQLLAYIYNFILRTGFYPASWKTSRTLMFPKPNKPPHSVSSYRPIQLTSTFSKILERILVKRLHSHLAIRNLLPLSQAGFRPQFSIDDLFLRLITHITNQYNVIKPSCLLLFDLEKAFDKVWHKALLLKLHRLRLPLSYIRLIYNFLMNRLAYVSINNAFSHPVFLHTGVPQGSALSPLLYILFVADFPSLPSNIHLYQYADDTAFLALGNTVQQISHTLQTAVDSFVKWCSTWQLTINTAKTQAILFLPPNRRTKVYRNPSNLHIRVDARPIHLTDTVKYLGVILHKHLKWKCHLQELSKKAYNRLNLIRRLTGTTWGLKAKAVINTYKAFLRPVLTYGHLAWINAPASFYKKLQIFERHALRIAYRIRLPSPTSALYDRISFPHILYHLETKRQKYFTTRYEDAHPLVMDTISQDTFYSPLLPLQDTPLSLLFSLYRYTIPPDHPDLQLINAFAADDPPSFITPSLTM